MSGPFATDPYAGFLDNPKAVLQPFFRQQRDCTAEDSQDVLLVLFPHSEDDNPRRVCGRISTNICEARIQRNKNTLFLLAMAMIPGSCSPLSP